MTATVIIAAVIILLIAYAYLSCESVHKTVKIKVVRGRDEWAGPCAGQDCKTITNRILDQSGATANPFIWPQNVDSCPATLGAMASGRVAAQQRLIRSDNFIGNGAEIIDEAETAPPNLHNSLTLPLCAGRRITSLNEVPKVMTSIFPAQPHALEYLDLARASVGRNYVSYVPLTSLPDHVPLNS